MKPRNFPARKLARQLAAEDYIVSGFGIAVIYRYPITEFHPDSSVLKLINQARAIRTKKVRMSLAGR